MPSARDLVAQRFQRAARAVGFRDVVTKGRCDGVAEVRERASEKLTAGLELRAQAEETERIVTRHVDAVAELVQKRVERSTALEREPREPCGDELFGAFVQRGDYLGRAAELRDRRGDLLQWHAVQTRVW